MKKNKNQIVEFGPVLANLIIEVISETISDSVHPLTFYCKVLTQSIVRQLEIHLSLHRSPGYYYSLCSIKSIDFGNKYLFISHRVKSLKYNFWSSHISKIELLTAMI
jgi:hypothetical protein